MVRSFPAAVVLVACSIHLWAQTKTPESKPSPTPTASATPLIVKFGASAVGTNADGKTLETLTVSEGVIKFDPAPVNQFDETKCDPTPWIDEELHPKTVKGSAKEAKQKPRCEDSDEYRTPPFVRLQYGHSVEYVRPELLSAEKGGLNLNTLKNRPSREDLGRFLLVEIGEGKESCKGGSALCYYAALLVNVSAKVDDNRWIEGFTVTQEGLRVNGTLFDPDVKKILGFAINGSLITDHMKGFIFGSRNIETYHVQLFEMLDGCRKYPTETTAQQKEAIDVAIPVLHLPERVDTGIHVAAPKVYDSYLLRSRLFTAGQQLAAISPWNTQAITSAYGSLQGVSRDTSYLAAQIQTAALPSQTITTNTGSTTLSPTVTNSQTAQCPAGYFPSQTSSSGVTCTQLPQQSQGCPAGYYVSQVSSSGSAIVCSQLPTSNPTAQLPPMTFTTTQTNAQPQSTQIQTTVPALSPTIPTAPASSALSAPTSVSQSSTAMLV